MSLRAKIMLSTVIFMVLVVGLLTLNVYYDVAWRENLERRRRTERLRATRAEHAAGRF